MNLNVRNYAGLALTVSLILLQSCGKEDAGRDKAQVSSATESSRQTSGSEPVPPPAIGQASPSRSAETIAEGRKLAAGFATSLRYQLQLGPEIERIANGRANPTHVAVIVEVLRHTEEVFGHRMRGQDENTVYVFPDGREGVYDAEGRLLENGFNDGTFNFFDEELEPLRRFTGDLGPWIAWGLNADDPTFLAERTRGFVSDLEGGIVRAREAWASAPTSTPIELGSDDFGRVETVALFLRVIESEGAEAFYGLVTGSIDETDELIIDTLARIDRGLVDAFSKLDGVLNPEGRWVP